MRIDRVLHAKTFRRIIFDCVGRRLKTGVIHSRFSAKLTFDMSGGRKLAQPACGRPLDKGLGSLARKPVRNACSSRKERRLLQSYQVSPAVTPSGQHLRGKCGQGRVAFMFGRE